MSLLNVENIRKSYGKTEVLKDISFSLKKGEVLAIIGSSGSGKTTLLRCLNFLETPGNGKISVNDKVLFDSNDSSAKSDSEIRKRRLHFGLVFQSFNLFPQYTVIENIMLAPKLAAKEQIKQTGEYMGAKSYKEAHEIIKSNAKSLLERVGLSEKSESYPCNLSGGQQQRVAIARALVCDPEIILLDEPLGALDLKLRKSMQLELKEIQQKTQKTFIYVTHDQEEALTMSDRVVVMNNGVIEQIGSPEDIYNEPVNAFVADFIGEANILNGIMLDDCRIQILGKELECVDKGFGRNTPVDVVIRPEDIEVTSPEDGQLVGTVENTTFKGVHYEMSVRCGKCEILIHSTKSAEIGSKIGMRVIPFNIQIMNKLLPFYDNVIETTVTYANQNDNSFEFELEGETVTVPDKYYEEGTKLKITLPPDALSLAGDGVGDLKDLYIESVVYKGEHNEIILESDERKWLMLSDTDEQVATYVPLSFNFSKARFEVISEFSEKEG